VEVSVFANFHKLLIEWSLIIGWSNTVYLSVHIIIIVSINFNNWHLVRMFGLDCGWLKDGRYFP